MASIKSNTFGVNNLEEHIQLCIRNNEQEYLHSLTLSVRAASSLFPEMLSEDDKRACVLVDNIFDMRLDLFGEKTKVDAELRSKIKCDIMTLLKESTIIQRDLYRQYEENRTIAISAVKELYESGIISKEKKGNSFILSMTEQQTQT
jgi:hypothetical protein